MLRLIGTAVVCVLALTAAGRADEKTKAEGKKPVGTWTRGADEQKITWIIKADTLTLKLKAGDTDLTIHAKYGVTDDNVLFAVITKIEKGESDGGPSKGDLFSFSYSTTKKELTLSDLKGTRVNDDARKLIEGVYTAE